MTEKTPEMNLGGRPDPPSKSLEGSAEKEFHFTKEEIFAQLGQEPTLQQLIAELEQQNEKKA